MRSVNANLLEINQAKSRINQAKKEGKTPDPKDLELVKTEKQNAFAILIETGANSDKNVWQQSGLPQMPIPPSNFVSSRTPI